MKRILALLCLTFSLHSAGCAAMTPSPEQSRYVYCNVYAASACFAVASGDVMTMRVPVDFVTYDVELLGGTKVTMYSGYNPPQVAVDANVPVKRYSNTSGRYEYAVTSEGGYVVTYTPSDSGSPIVQVVAAPEGGRQMKQFADFLGAFRACKSDGFSAICNKEEVLFEAVAKEVRN